MVLFKYSLTHFANRYGLVELRSQGQTANLVSALKLYHVWKAQDPLG